MRAAKSIKKKGGAKTADKTSSLPTLKSKAAAEDAGSRGDRSKRLLDLVMILLRARTPVTYREIRDLFPGYQTVNVEAGLRAFERDKADLLDLGVPIRYVTPDEDDSLEDGGYVIDLKRFKMPEVRLTPDEISALVLAASVAHAMPGGSYPKIVDLALKKLAFDLPELPDTPTEFPRPASSSPTVLVHFPERQALARPELGEIYATLEAATRLRKRVGDIIFARLGDNPSGEESRDPDDLPTDSTPRGIESAARDSARRAAARAGRSAREIAAADSADSARAALLRAASAATGRGEEILDFEGDETPVVAINRPLLEAYNAMWEASRELDQGETGLALPPMRRALEAIQRARQAERIYLRGKAPAVVVDLGRIRLTGKDSGAANNRTPRQPADPAAARRAERLAQAIALAGTSPAAAIDSIVLLRVESLDVAPRLAAALADALDSMRNGRDATTLLARARRIADGTVRGMGQLGTWSGVW